MVLTASHESRLSRDHAIGLMIAGLPIGDAERRCKRANGTSRRAAAGRPMLEVELVKT
jgi:hypothetical protein